MTSPPPLVGIRVLEFAGLAPGPFAGLLLADYGATVLRVDRPAPGAIPTADQLTRRKSSISVNLKSPPGIALLKTLLSNIDVLIDPFRPGVLEKLGLGPDVCVKINSRLIYARMTGFRRDGKYAQMAGHDINYIAVSGILSLLGRAHEKPFAPGNILGDFAGGGLMCFVGIVLALLARGNSRGGRGQVVEANMVDGSAFLGTMPRLALKSPVWGGQRGTNMLDGGCPFYDTYETKDGKYMAVGALEPQFFAALLKGLGISSLPIDGDRLDKENWPALKDLFTKIFKTKSRAEWEQVFDGTDACCTPVLTHSELETDLSFDQRPAVTLRGSPALAITDAKEDVKQDEDGAGGEDDVRRGQGIGVDGEGWSSEGLASGTGGEEVLERWCGWRRGRHYEIQEGGLVATERSRL